MESKPPWDEVKRQATLTNRNLNFADAEKVIVGKSLTFPDARQDYGEVRLITVGFLRGRMTVLVWTQRGTQRRIISMRNANEREIIEYQSRLG